ncbi:MAG: hypothetical protein CFE37_13305 [Alphaproteobacteria bacterium PA4]|nr:MAG: hypothetical protein CFE37_13305 [Alphaproteobacteria bacterium PA4]
MLLVLASAPARAQTAAPAPAPATSATAPTPPAVDARPAYAPPAAQTTYTEDDVLGAAEDVFGKGAQGLAEIIRKTFAKNGQPNGYIVGREVGGAFIVGVRYGSGTLFHKVEGEQKVHWTGPSLGVDFGGDGSKTFALVYDLFDTDDLFHRYGGAEGKAYFVGGFSATVLQREKVVIVPIKLGVGLRLGVNVGYMKFSKKGQVSPF